jgi:UrcA family protein
MNDHIDAKLITRMLGTVLFGAALFSGISVGATPAANAQFADAKSITVQFADLNLQNPQGIARLYTRIHNAAKNVCGVPSGDDMNFAVVAAEERCVRDSETRAIEATHVPALAAFYAKKAGVATPVLAASNTK